MAQGRRSSIENRILILKVAERVFEERGYTVTTMKDIAHEAGVTESVLYRHYPSKATLFRESVLLPLVNVLTAFSEASARYLEHPLDDRSMTRLVMGSLLDQLSDHRAALRSFVAAEDELDPEARADLHRALSEVMDKMGEIAEAEGERRGSPRGGLGQAMSPRLSVAMFISLIVHDAWLLPSGSDRPTRAQLLDHITEFTLGAVTGLHHRPR